MNHHKPPAETLSDKRRRAQAAGVANYRARNPVKRRAIVCTLSVLKEDADRLRAHATRQGITIIEAVTRLAATL